MRSWIPKLQKPPKRREIPDSQGSRRQPKALNGLSPAAVISTGFGRPLSVPLLWPPLGLTPGAIAAPAPRSPRCGAVCIPKKKCGAVCIPPQKVCIPCSRDTHYTPVWCGARSGARPAPVCSHRREFLNTAPGVRASRPAALPRLEIGPST